MDRCCNRKGMVRHLRERPLPDFQGWALCAEGSLPREKELAYFESLRQAAACKPPSKTEKSADAPSPAFKNPTSHPDFLSYCYFQPKNSSCRQNFLLKTLQWFENFIYLHLVRLNVILTGPRRLHRRSPHGKNHSKNCFLVRLKTTKALPSYDAVLLVVFHVFSDRDFPTWGAPFFQQQTEAGPSRWPDGDDVQLVYSFTSQLYTCIHLFINHMQAWAQGLHAFSGQNNGITRAREAIRGTWSDVRQFWQPHAFARPHPEQQDEPASSPQCSTAPTPPPRHAKRACPQMEQAPACMRETEFYRLSPAAGNSLRSTYIASLFPLDLI